MHRAHRTGFDRFVEEHMKQPSAAQAYAEARAEVDAVDALIRALDAARSTQGINKADLARAAEMRPEAIRRLFTVGSPNPTLATVVRIARELGYSLALVPLAKTRPRPRRRATG
jgi:DNA-binding phage protein